MTIALVVPVLSNFIGLADLFSSCTSSVFPIVLRNDLRDGTDHARGVAASWNEGLTRAAYVGCSHAAVVNDDVVLSPGVLDRLVVALASDPTAILVSACEEGTDDRLEASLSHRARYSCFVVEPHAFLGRTGGFDERFTPAYFEDDDMLRRLSLHVPGGPVNARRRGKRLDFRVPSCKVVHKGSQTINRSAASRAEAKLAFEANQARYVAKWGGLPGFETKDVPISGPFWGRP